MVAQAQHCLNLNSQSDMRQITYLVIVLGTADYWLLNLELTPKIICKTSLKSKMETRVFRGRG